MVVGVAATSLDAVVARAVAGVVATGLSLVARDG